MKNYAIKARATDFALWWPGRSGKALREQALELNPSVVLDGSRWTCVGDGAKAWVGDAGVDASPVMAVKCIIEDHADVEA